MCIILALHWALVFLVSWAVASLATPTGPSDLVIVTTGIPITTIPNPMALVDLSDNTDFTTDSTKDPIPPLELSSMNVTSVINLRYAHTTILTKMMNPAKDSQEASFSIILPETAFITGFVMILDGIPYTAYVKGKEEAKSIYEQAVNQNLGAAHIAAKARDSNHFTVSVNIEPSTEALFNLTYEELLIRRLEVYNHVVNLYPGRLVPDLSVNVFIKEGRKITTLRVPELRTGNEIDAQKNDTANKFASIERNSDSTEAYITFAPNLKQQQTLMQIYAEKSKESDSQSDSDNHLSPQSMDGMLGQFVVQYDVERDPNYGEVLVNDGYFVHFFSPSGLKPLNKHAIFVLDTSGSMRGQNIEQLRQAMASILGELKPGDYFSIVEFNEYAQVYDLKSLNKSYKYADRILPPPAPATPQNVQTAKVVIKNMLAGGSTNIYEALDMAVKLANTYMKGNMTSAKPPENPQENGTRVDAVLYPDLEDQNPDPIIIFLTDGYPTEGEVDRETILGRVSELNSGYNQTAIFSLGFGEDADRDFLRKLSLRNSGFLRNIYEAADATQQLQQFYSQVASPLLSHVRFVYPTDQIDRASITKYEFKTLFCGAELVVAGKLLNKDVERITVIISAISSMGPIEFIPKPFTPIETAKTYGPLERLWVYLHIKQLLDQMDAGKGTIEADKLISGNEKHKQEALELALQYSFVTQLTSLVVIKPNNTIAVNAESVDEVNMSYVPSKTYNSGSVIRHRGRGRTRSRNRSRIQSLSGSSTASCNLTSETLLSITFIIRIIIIYSHHKI